MNESEVAFPATLGSRERLVTFLVGYGVALAMPAGMGVLFALVFSEAWPLLLPVPFMLVFGAAYLFRPVGFSVSDQAIFVQRPAASIRIPLEGLASVRLNPEPAWMTGVGILGVRSFYGTFGLFWNRRWGRFRAYITNGAKVVELRFEDGRRVLVSPDDAEGFAEQISQVMRHRNREDH